MGFVNTPCFHKSSLEIVVICKLNYARWSSNLEKAFHRAICLFLDLEHDDDASEEQQISIPENHVVERQQPRSRPRSTQPKKKRKARLAVYHYIHPFLFLLLPLDLKYHMTTFIINWYFCLDGTQSVKKCMHIYGLFSEARIADATNFISYHSPFKIK